MPVGSICPAPICLPRTVGSSCAYSKIRMNTEQKNNKQIYTLHTGFPMKTNKLQNILLYNIYILYMRTIYTHAHTEEASELYLCDIKQPADYIFSSNILNILYMFMYFETQLMLRARDPQIIRNPELPEFSQQLDQFKENSGRIITNMFNQFHSKGSIRCCMYSHNIFTYYSECWMQCYSLLCMSICYPK